MGQLFLLVTMAAIYLGVMAQGISLPIAIVWVGNVFNAATTAAFFLLDNPWADPTPRWSRVIRNIAIGTLCGGLHGIGITESLRRMRPDGD